MLTVALGQMEVIPGHPDKNAAAMLKMIHTARSQNANLIIFPEMAIPGYLLGDLWEQSAFLRDCEYYGQLIAAAAQDIVVLFGNVGIDWKAKNNDGRVRKYNALFTASQGKLVQDDVLPYPFRIKTLLPNYREFEDPRHFYSLEQWAREQNLPVASLLQPLQVPISGTNYSIGCLLCEDGWSDDYPIKPIKLLSQHPVDFFVNISSSPFTAGKNNKRNRIFSRQVKETGIPLIYVNQVGMQNNGKTVYTFDGYSTVYDSAGKIRHCCPPFQETLEFISLETKQPEMLAAPEISVKDDQDIATLYAAIHYGIQKFLTATGIHKVVIGISGGIDSAVNAALYERVVGKDNLLLVNMPSRFNSSTTRSAAEILAKNLHCHYTVLPIEEAVEHTIKQLQETPIDRLADGSSYHLTLSDLVKENIQARDRSSRLLAGVAAAFGGGFTCNANKSEMTVGYCTLYGDEAGFLAATADLWKHQVYELAAYLNTKVYGREVIPRQTINLVPSAELSSEQSVDEGKGDPLFYPYHDYLFRAFVEHWNRSTPEDILRWYSKGIVEENLGCQPNLVKQHFPTAAAFISDLERWWNLYAGMGVAKRIQAPPVLAVSRRAFGFDHREAQNRPYYTTAYQNLKKALLEKEGVSYVH